MGLNIGKMVATALNTAGKVVDDLLKDGVLVTRTEIYDAQSGAVTRVEVPVPFVGVRKEYTAEELAADRDRAIERTDFKLVAAATQFNQKPEIGLMVRIAGYNYMIKNIAEDAVGATYEMQLRGQTRQ